MTKQKLLDLIDEAKIAELFKELDELNINSNVFNSLREEFIGGNTNPDYYKRLKVFVGSLKLPEPTPTLSPMVRELQRPEDFAPVALQNMMDRLPADIASQLDIMTDYERKLFIAKFKELQDQINKNLNQFFTHDIFETIISPNVPLSEVDKNKLYAISSSTYQDKHISWIEKCLIVSALSISFVNKYDTLRLDLLLSFVFGYEEKVWQRALVGVILGLYKRDKIARGDKNIYAKFEQLKDLTHVQEAIYYITIALETERYKKQEIPDFFKEEQNSEFFQKPQHWFLPFDENSTWVKSALEKAIEIHNFDYIGFQAILGKTVGLLDTEKYSLCFALPRFSERQLEDKIKELEDFYQRQEEASVENTWVYARFLRNLLTDLYRFHLLYPKSNLRKIFEEQISIAETPVLELLAENQNKQRIEMDRWEEIGKVCVDDEDYEKAIVILQKAVELKPNSVNAWWHLAYANGGVNQHEKTIEFYLEVLKLNPNDDSAWYNLGIAYYELKNYKNAVESYQEAIKIKHDKDAAWNNLGLVYIHLEKYEKAIESSQKAIEFKPDNNLAWNILGIAYAHLQEYDNARQAFQEAIKIKPNDSLAWGKLGLAYVHLQEYKNAYQAFQNAIERNPNDSSNNYNIACIFCLQKDKIQTLSYLKQSIIIDTNNKEIAKTDTDFEWLWEDADFKALVA